MAKKQKPLPQKEAALYRSIQKLFYERKQYKKGLKLADQLLKKFPEHGETLAMKGLILNAMDRRAEAFECCKKGIRFDLTSHLCWHALGTLHRFSNDYAEAAKCYSAALRHDKENPRILQDLSFLQIQLRQYKNYKETRRKIVQLNYKQKTNWIAFSIASHLAKDYKSSLQALEQFSERPEQPDYESSEVVLYKNMIIEESGDLEGALKQLEEDKSVVVDQLSWQEKKAELLLKMGKKEEAKEEYLALLEINSDNFSYWNGYLKSHDLPEFFTPRTSYYSPSVQNYDENSPQFEILNNLSEKFPYSHTVRELPLRFFSGDRFRTAMDKYLRRGFTKGTPALFSASKWIYSTPEKIQIIEDLLTSYLKSLETSQTWPGSEQKLGPSVLLWVTFFAAQHYDLKRDHKKAFDFLDRAIQHTPTIIDLYSAKGKFYKHAGDLQRASAEFERARELDLADRYLNTKSTLHLLRSDQVEKAENVIGLFTKEGDHNTNNLYDMQCMWYEKECGQSWERLGKYGLALKQFDAILTHFRDIFEDQYDFHTYCPRKKTLRSYITLLRFEDTLFSHPNYLAAISAFIRIYLVLHEKPKEEPKAEEDPFANLSAQEQKKLRRKLAKEQKKKEAEEQQKKANEQQKKNQDQSKAKNEAQKDPNGEKFIEVADKLQEANKYVQMVRGYANRHLEIQQLSFKVYMLRKKYLLALQALKTALHLAPSDPLTHRNRIQFLREVQVDVLEKEGANPVAAEVLKEEISGLYHSGCSALEQLNQAYLEKNSQSLLAVISGAEVMTSLDSSKRAAAIDQVRSVLASPNTKFQLMESVEGHQRVLSVFKDEAIGKEMFDKFQTLFPWSSYFNPSLATLDQQPPASDSN